MRAAHEYAGDADLVVSNPPYVEPGRGRTPRQPSRARARSGALSAFTGAARHCLGRRGRACFVYPAPELGTLFALLRAAGLEPKRMRAVHASPTRPARVVLVEAQPGKAGGLVIEAPLVERA
jgi:tRNA1Val (adenine37-N6)-methyltransferase